MVLEQLGDCATVRLDGLTPSLSRGSRNAEAVVRVYLARRVRSSRKTFFFSRGERRRFVARRRRPLRTRHRLLLSGTPIQNHAVELWSLFDFLMPGFLGSEAHFHTTYAKPIHAARGARGST